MAWLGSITAAGTIVESKKYMTNRLWVIFGESRMYTQTRTVTVTRYPGLTQAAAETAALDFSNDDDVIDSHTEKTGGGSYAVEKTEDVSGDWEVVEP